MPPSAHSLCRRGHLILEGRYAICLEEENVGRVVIQRQGLYYRFDCRCNLKKNHMYRLMMDQGGKLINLGIPIPSADGYWLVTKKPVKEFGGEEPNFRLAPKLQGNQFIPVYPDEPFSYLDRLQNAYMEHRDGVLGVVISAPGLPDNDRSP